MAMGFESSSLDPARSTSDASKTEHMGLLADFCGGFENSLKSQMNGAVQLANKLGANFDETKLAPVDKADFGSKEWAAGLAGQAAALSIELFAARRLGAGLRGGQLEAGLKAGQLESGSLAAMPKLTETAGTKIASSIALGGVLGGVLTPTDDKGNFWSDRLRNTVAGAITFGAMGGASVGIEAAGVKLGSGVLASSMRNGYINNAVGGFVGGSVGDVAGAGLSGELPTASKDYWQHVAQSGTEFALVGLGSHTIGRVSEHAASLGEQRPGTDRTNAKYYTDLLGITKDLGTSNTQADFKVVSGKPQLDRMQSDVHEGADKAQAEVVVKQRLHGVLSDFLGEKFRPLGSAKLMLLSHGTELTPQSAGKYDLIGTCSQLDGALKVKDVFQNRSAVETDSGSVWLTNRTNDTFSLTREKVQRVQDPSSYEPVMLGSIGRGFVEVSNSPLRPGDSLRNSIVEITRLDDGRVVARGRSQSDGIWEKIPVGKNIPVSETDNLYHGQNPVHSAYLGTSAYFRAGHEIADKFQHVVGKDQSGQLYVRDDNSPDGIFIRRAPGHSVELTTDDKFVHLGPRGIVEVKIAPTLNLSPTDVVLVNGKILNSGSDLTFGRAVDRDVRYPDSDRSVSRIHGSVARDAHGQIFVTDASSFGTYLKLPREIKVPLNPTDTIGIINSSGVMEMHPIINLSVKTSAEAQLQPAQGNLKIEPVYVGRTARGDLYVQDNSTDGVSWLKLRKLEATPVQANDQLIVGTSGSRLNLDFNPVVPSAVRVGVPPNNPPLRQVAMPMPAAQAGVNPFAPATPAPQPQQPFRVATPVPPVAPPAQPFQPAQPGTPHRNPLRAVLQPGQQPLTPAHPGPHSPLPFRRELRISQATGERYTYKVREPFRSPDPAEMKEHLEYVEKQALKPIHKGEWSAIAQKGTFVDSPSLSTYLFDDPSDARRASSLVEGILNRKTKGTADVGYGAKIMNGKWAPTVNWDGVEGVVSIDRITKLPEGILGRRGMKYLPS